MSRATGARFRQRKLSTKQSLRVVREDEVPDLITADDDAGRVIPRLETGVEKAEETVSTHVDPAWLYLARH